MNGEGCDFQVRFWFWFELDDYDWCDTHDKQTLEDSNLKPDYTQNTKHSGVIAVIGKIKTEITLNTNDTKGMNISLLKGNCHLCPVICRSNAGLFSGCNAHRCSSPCLCICYKFHQYVSHESESE